MIEVGFFKKKKNGEKQGIDKERGEVSFAVC